MGRALVIVALLLAWAAVARADTTVYVSVTGITVELPGEWTKSMDAHDGLEFWNYRNPDTGDFALVGFPAEPDEDCNGMIELTRNVEDPEDSAWVSETFGKDLRAMTFCTLTAKRTYAMLVAIPVDGENESIPMVTMTYTMALAQRDGFPPDDAEQPETVELYLAVIERSILAPADWVVDYGDAASATIESESDDDFIVELSFTTDFRCDQVSALFQEQNPTMETRAPTIELPAGWSGLEYDRYGWMGIYCRDHAGGSLLADGLPEENLQVMRAIDAALDGGTIDTNETTHTIALSTIGVSIEVPGTWEVRIGDGADLIVEDGVDIAAVMSPSENDCATMVGALRNPDDEDHDLTISLPSGWNGVEGSWGSLYCRERDGARVVVSAPPAIATVLIGGIEAALGASSTEVTRDRETSRSRTRGGGVIGGFLPLTAHLALIRRSDDMGSGFGFGLQLARMGWREDQRFTIGYEVGAAAASGFWELGAQVRPSVSPKFKDLPVDAYVALGVDATGGKHQMETDVQPVFGGGAEVLFTLPGIGADLAAQALADPGGFHSYTLHGGLLFGQNEGRFRLGASYVKLADDTSVLWITFGFTKLELR